MCDMSASGMMQYMDHKGTVKFNETIRVQKDTQNKPKDTTSSKAVKKSSRKPNQEQITQQTTPPLPLPKPAEHKKASAPSAATTKTFVALDPVSEQPPSLEELP